MASDRGWIVFAVEPQTVRQDELSPASAAHPAPKEAVSFRSAPDFSSPQGKSLGLSQTAPEESCLWQGTVGPLFFAWPSSRTSLLC